MVIVCIETNVEKIFLLTSKAKSILGGSLKLLSIDLMMGYDCGDYDVV